MKGVFKMIYMSQLNKNIYRPKEVSDMIGMSLRNFQKHMSESKINTYQLESGHRRITKDALIDYLRNQDLLVEDNDRMDVVYSRVSTYKQKKRGDLDRQIQRVNNEIVIRSPQNLKYFSDVGSGLNDNRKELRNMFNLVMDNKVNRIFVLYKDRLTRFGFNYLKIICDKHHTDIVVLSSEMNDKTLSEELAEDIISIIHSFSGRLYGMRGRVRDKVVKELED